MDTIHLAICDDEAEDLAKTLALVKEYDTTKRLRITSLSCPDTLMHPQEPESIDIVLMDIEMEPVSGFDAASQIVSLPHPPVIIFTTKSSAYALKGYGIAIRYLQKPLSRDAFFEALDVAVAEASAHRLTIHADNTLHTVLLRDVEYIEIFGHYAVIHTQKESYRFRSTLKDILSRLPQGYFVPTHKSFIVNLEHIRSATATQASLSCGACIPISRSRQQEFNQALYRFLGR